MKPWLSWLIWPVWMRDLCRHPSFCSFHFFLTHMHTVWWSWSHRRVCILCASLFMCVCVRKKNWPGLQNPTTWLNQRLPLFAHHSLHFCVLFVTYPESMAQYTNLTLPITTTHPIHPIVPILYPSPKPSSLFLKRILFTHGAIHWPWFHSYFPEVLIVCCIE